MQGVEGDGLGAESSLQRIRHTPCLATASSWKLLIDLDPLLELHTREACLAASVKISPAVSSSRPFS